jgi:phosphoadenosine phosphosulfate reductase
MLTNIVEICKINVDVYWEESMLASTSSQAAASEEWTDVNARLAQSTPQAILEWAIARFQPRLTMATAFGAEGCLLIHLLAEIDAKVRVFNLDTGYQFPETLALREQLRKRYGIEVELVRPETTMAEYENQHGGPMYVTHPDQCCYDRKIVPLRRALVGYDAWITAIRADQSSHRAAASVVGVDRKFGLVKVNPLLNWTRRDVWAFIATHDVPYNSLHDQGYASIGCWPCTRAVAISDDERAGRWAGHAKTECGLHSLDSSLL